MSDPMQDAPDSESIVELLRERYAIERSLQLEVEIDLAEEHRRIIVQIERPAKGKRIRQRWKIEVIHRRGEESWVPIVDAVDALVGSLIETDYAYRDLPTGEEVQHGDSVFSVRVESSRPDLEREADRMLTKD